MVEINNIVNLNHYRQEQALANNFDLELQALDLQDTLDIGKAVFLAKIESIETSQTNIRDADGERTDSFRFDIQLAAKPLEERYADVLLNITMSSYKKAHRNRVLIALEKQKFHVFKGEVALGQDERKCISLINAKLVRLKPSEIEILGSYYSDEII